MKLIINTSIEGTLGNGSGSITVTNVNGNILATGY